MKITHSISLDFRRYKTPSQIDVVQDDTYSRYVTISLYDNEAEWPVPDGATIAVRFKKPDKTQGVYDTLPNGEVAYSIDGNVVTVGIAPQMLVAKGKVTASAVIYLGSVQLATFPFVLNVIENPAAGQSVSRDYYYLSTFAAVNEAIGDLNNLQTSTKESLVAAINELAQGTVTEGVGCLESKNDTTDRLAEIQALLDAYGYVKLGKGEFYLSGQLKIRNGATLDGCGKATVIKQTPDSEQSSMIHLQSEGTIRNVCLQGEWTTTPTADTTYNAYRIGIVISGGTNNAIVDGCWIWGWTAQGVFASGNSAATRSFLMSNCDVCYCGTGLYLEETEYACISNCAFRNNKYGVENKGGNNKFSACGFDMNVEGFRLMGGYNTGHGSAVGCTFNHNSVRAVRVSGVETGYVFSGCQFHYGCININTGKGILYSGCQFGNDMKYWNYTANPTRFVDCNFSQTPQTEATEYLDAYNGLRFVNCINYLKDEIVDNVTENWTFTLEDGSTVTKAVYVG